MSNARPTWQMDMRERPARRGLHSTSARIDQSCHGGGYRLCGLIAHAVLTGQVTTSAPEPGLQEADSFSPMMPITKHNFRILTPSEIPEAIKRGVAIANAGRKGPVHIDLPSDVQKGEVPDQEMSREFPDSPPLEDFADLPEALKILKSAERPLLLVGGGIIWSNASGEVVRLAEMLMAPVATTIMAKGVIPEDHPLSLGIIGMHGREVARKAFPSGRHPCGRNQVLGPELRRPVRAAHIHEDNPCGHRPRRGWQVRSYAGPHGR